ncbi:MAG: hypothetical protein HYZ68_07050 [Chloroflexi bacterium]|nr:hypothetical protein [Chloroflexota bacterium]
MGEVATLPVTRFVGSHYEIGLQMGPRLRTVPLPPADEGRVRFAQRCEGLAREVYPPLLEKVEGMIAGGDLPATPFKAYFYGRGGPPQVGCTNIAVMPEITPDGQLWVARNYDWYYEARPWREVRQIAPQGALRHLGVTHHWAGSPDGMNERGLVVLLAALPGLDATGPGLHWHMLIDILLETCANAQQARAFITSVPHLLAFNYLIADAQEAMVAEATPQGVTLREPEEGILVATNHLPGREQPEGGMSEGERLRQRLSIRRYQRARELLGERRGALDVEALQAILRDHEGGLCRGNHPTLAPQAGFHASFGTIWSLVGQPERREFLVAPDHPCQVEYKAYRWMEYSDD